MKDLSHLSFLSHLKFFFFHFALNSFVFVLVYFVFLRTEPVQGLI